MIVPCGTLIKDKKTQEILFDLTEPGQKILLCKGGKGGKGNHHFKSSTHQAPQIFTEGTEGESKEIEFELKLIADVGLVGMPNAGKSTLLSSLAFIPVKIGAYPFTTLHPNLGYIQYPDRQKILLADIPGIIEHAHANKGLGLSFLKHIERTSLLVFVIDISGFEERDPLEDFQVLQNELKAYQPQMLEKPFLVALNKVDLEGAAIHIARFLQAFPIPKERVFPISAAEGEGLPLLLAGIRSLKDSLVSV